MHTTIIIPQSHANFAHLLPGDKFDANRTVIDVEDDITKNSSTNMHLKNDVLSFRDVNINRNYTGSQMETGGTTLPRNMESRGNPNGLVAPKAFKSSTLPHNMKYEPQNLQDRKGYRKTNQLFTRVAQQMHDIISDLKNRTLKRDRTCRNRERKTTKNFDATAKHECVENEYDMNFITNRTRIVTNSVRACVINNVSANVRYESSFNQQSVLYDDSYGITPDKMRRVALHNQATQKRLWETRNQSSSRNLVNKLSSGTSETPPNPFSGDGSHVLARDVQIAPAVCSRRLSLEPLDGRHCRSYSDNKNSNGRPNEPEIITKNKRRSANQSFDAISDIKPNVIHRLNGSLVRRNSSKLSACTRSSSYRTKYTDEEHIYETIPGDDSFYYILWNGDTPLFTRRNLNIKSSRGSVESFVSKNGVSKVVDFQRNSSPPLPSRLKHPGMKTYHSMETLNAKTSCIRRSYTLDSLHIDDYETIVASDFQRDLKTQLKSTDGLPFSDRSTNTRVATTSDDRSIRHDVKDVLSHRTTHLPNHQNTDNKQPCQMRPGVISLPNSLHNLAPMSSSLPIPSYV